MQQVNLHGKEFTLYIDEAKIKQRVAEIGSAINTDFSGKHPFFISILKGAYVFTADLLRHINIDAEIAFLQLSSYSGTSSTGTVKLLSDLPDNIIDRHLIIIEDIIDTGTSMNALLPIIKSKKPASISLATLLSKPTARVHNIQIDYTGFEVPDKFVVGYGLDYDEAGRNLPHIYALAD